MQLVDGPFKALQGDWLFSPVGSDGCQIELRLRHHTPADNAAVPTQS
jgi:ribosome-associated toxin RatA of RatAB toxin-antitoxin module